MYTFSTNGTGYESTDSVNIHVSTNTECDMYLSTEYQEGNEFGLQPRFGYLIDSVLQSIRVIKDWSIQDHVLEEHFTYVL